MSQNKTSFFHFLAELETLCKKQATGTVFITTDKNQLAQINLDRGMISNLSILNKYGIEAIPVLSQIENCEFNFIPGPTSTPDPSLPANAEIILQLRGGGSPDEATQAPEKIRLLDVNKKVLQEVLTEYLGPVAAMVCKKHLAGINNPEAAVAVLAEQITDSADAEEFKKIARQRLRVQN